MIVVLHEKLRECLFCTVRSFDEDNVIQEVMDIVFIWDIHCMAVNEIKVMHDDCKECDQRKPTRKKK